MVGASDSSRSHLSATGLSRSGEALMFVYHGQLSLPTVLARDPEIQLAI